MTKRSLRRRVTGALLTAVLLKVGTVTGALSAEPAARTEMVAVIHLHTTVSGGDATPLELARAARASAVDAVVVTDHFLEKVTYAPWPIGNVIGVSLSRPSVVSFGIERYLATLAAAEKHSGGVLVLPGVEVTPYSRWSGSLLARTLTLAGWHRHVLVIGLEDPRSLGDLPAADNLRAGRFGWWSAVYLLPALLLLWSVARLARPGHRTARLASLVPEWRRAPILPGAVGVLSMVLLVAGFPYRVPRWSAVAADPEDAPFLCLENYVRALGGVTAWAHPEAAADKEERGVRIVTAPYPEMVVRTDADVFGALPEGVRTLLPPGGLWDRALADHVAGRRRGAPFAIAENDEHRAAREVDLESLQTVCSVRERSHAGLVEALRAGRVYARWTPTALPPLRLIEWEARSAQGGVAGAGETLRDKGALTLRLGVEGGDGREVTARIVRLGEVIWSARLVPPFRREVIDDPGRSSAYRVDVEGAYPYRLIGNPIFVATPDGAREGA